MTAGFGPEQRLLVELVRGDSAPPAVDARDLAILGDGELQERFFSLAASHGVQGLVLWRLAQPGDPPLVQPALATGARATLRELRSRAVLWDLERDRVIWCLAANGLNGVVLKGAALRHTVYSEPVQRSLADIDVLVAMDEVDAAVEALRRSGYRAPYSDEAIDAYRRHHFHIRLTNGDFLVEVHWGLTRPTHPFQLDAGPVLRRSIVCDRPGRPPLRVPSPEDMILHMASQNLDDRLRLSRLVDIDRVMRATEKLEWDYVVESAREGGLQVGLAVSLRLCEVLLGTPIPYGHVERLGVGWGTRLHLALMQPRRWPVSPSRDRVTVGELKQFWLTAGWRRRLRSLTRQLVSAGDPLSWVWEERPADVAGSTPVKGAIQLAKTLTYQGWLYLNAAARCLSPAGRRQVRFWH